MKETTLFRGSRYAPIPKLFDQSHGLMVMPSCPEFRTFYTHTVTSSDTIPGLAHLYYGDSKIQWAILVSNEIPFPLKLVPGQSLLIPKREEVFAFLDGRSQ